MPGTPDLVEATEAEAQRQAMAATSVTEPKQPPTTPPPSYSGHPIEHARRHAKGRW